MRIAVSSQGDSLNSPASPVFGRCLTYIFVDTDTLEYEVVANPAINQGGGAGIQAAQFVVEHGADALLTGNLGPNAFDVLQAAEVMGYRISGGTVRQAVEAFKAGHLQPMGGASVTAHAGMGGARNPGALDDASEVVADPGLDEELERLRDTLSGLRVQLAETMEQIERLEEEY